MRAEDEPQRPIATLSAFDIACVVIGGIIGIGIFFSPAKVAASVDSYSQVIAVWSIGGAMILVGALVYARLSQVAPGYGGVFEYLRSAFGPMPAFLYGWCNLAIIQAGALAVVGLVMVDNLDSALGNFAPEDKFSDGMKVVLATTAILSLTLLNALGLRLGRGTQILFTVIKTTAVFAIVVIALFAETGSVPGGSAISVAAPSRPEIGFFRAMSVSILPVLFACGGWQHGSFVSTVARRPLRDVPIGIVCGVVVVVVAYLLVNLAYLDLLGLEAAGQSKTIAVDAVRAAFGDGETIGNRVSRIFGAVIVVSALGVLNTICMAPPYVLHAMAKKGLFFRGVARLHERFGTPLVAIVVQGAWASALLWITQVLAWQVNDPADPAKFDPLGFLLDGVVFVDWMFYGACGVALVVILRRRESLARGDRAYGIAGGVFALSALAVTVGAIFTTRWPSAAGLFVLGVGCVAYRAFTAAARRRDR